MLLSVLYFSQWQWGVNRVKLAVSRSWPGPKTALGTEPRGAKFLTDSAKSLSAKSPSFTLRPHSSQHLTELAKLISKSLVQFCFSLNYYAQHNFAVFVKYPRPMRGKIVFGTGLFFDRVRWSLGSVALSTCCDKGASLLVAIEKQTNRRQRMKRHCSIFE